jgi:hypothetical protein
MDRGSEQGVTQEVGWTTVTKKKGRRGGTACRDKPSGATTAPNYSADGVREKKKITIGTQDRKETAGCKQSSMITSPSLTLFSTTDSSASDDFGDKIERAMKDREEQARKSFNKSKDSGSSTESDKFSLRSAHTRSHSRNERDNDPTEIGASNVGRDTKMVTYSETVQKNVSPLASPNLDHDLMLRELLSPAMSTRSKQSAAQNYNYTDISMWPTLNSVTEITKKDKQLVKVASVTGTKKKTKVGSEPKDTIKAKDANENSKEDNGE